MSALDVATALQLDAKARADALATHRSLLLQAPAGSGKTTVLTARYLALLCVAAAPEQILAITFTRKAAAEMRQRILAALQAADAQRSVPGIDAGLIQAARECDRVRGWNLLRSPSRLRIQTIDALHYELASQAPIAAGSGPGLNIATEAQPLYRRAARHTLRQAPLEAPTAQATELLFARLDNNWLRLEKLLAEMLERRLHWLPRVLQASGDGGLVERVERSLASSVSAELAHALARLPAPLLREGEQLLVESRPTGDPSASLSAEGASLPRWRALCELALTQSGWRRRLTVTEGFARTAGALKQRALDWIEALKQVPQAEALLFDVRALPDAQLVAEDREALEALALLLVRAAAELQLQFAAADQVDYSYVAAAARAALNEQGEPTDLALRAGAGIRHLLVDEFQDTSLEQYELLRALTASWERGDGRTLFVVGDPMQSIYQFREAEVGLFVRSRDHGLGDIRFEALQLRRNFRSRAGLIDWVNEHFARLFPAADDARRAAIRYLPSVAAEPEPETFEPLPPVSLHRFDVGESEAEAACVARIVLAERVRQPDASVAVLLASREHAAAVVAQLRAAGVPLRGVDLERLQERAVVRDLAALTRALLHGEDRTAWLALLRAPWCGLSLAELERGFADALLDPFTQLAQVLASPPNEEPAAAALQGRLARVQAALEPAVHGAERGLALWRRVEHCWLRLAGPAIYRSEQELLDAQRFLDALALHAAPEALAGEALSQLTARLFSSAPPQRGAVEIMTMHAAKGLEWDVVILPALGRRTRVDTDPLLHWLELPRASSGTDLLLAPIRVGVQEARNSVAGYIKRLRRERLRLERVRLLYVAATRARRALHLLGELPLASADEADAAPKPPPRSLLEVLWPAIGAEFLAQPSGGSPRLARAQAADAPAAARATLWRLPAEWRMPAPPPLSLGPRLAFLTPDTDMPPYAWVGLAARAVGTIVHAELHRLASGAAAEHAARDYSGWLAELGVAAHEWASANARIREALRRTQTEERGRWLLSNAHPQSQSEWRLTGLHEGRVVNVIFDRMLLDEQGDRWVVDYKTSTHEGADLAAFIDAEAERYRAQLQRYAQLAAQLGSQPVRVALYFPLLGAFRELDLGQH